MSKNVVVQLFRGGHRYRIRAGGSYGRVVLKSKRFPTEAETRRSIDTLARCLATGDYRIEETP